MTASGAFSRMRERFCADQWTACEWVMTTATVPAKSGGVRNMPGTTTSLLSPTVMTRVACSYLVIFTFRLYAAGYPPGVYALSMIADIKKRALHRTKILEGQLRGVEKMIDDEAYCVDIIPQTLAIQKSLSSLNKLLVENHLRTHVTEMFDSGGDEREAAVTELLTVFELTNNRGQ